MSEGDYGFFGDVLGQDYGGDVDVATAGAGGDPYGGGDWGGFDDGAEAYATGMLPGGAENQFTPFSPGGGWDFTDVLKGAAGGGAMLARGLVGPNGYLYDTRSGGGGGEIPNLGVGPMVRSRSQGGVPVALDTTSSAGDIVRWVRQSTGLRVTARSIVSLIVRYGFNAAAALTQLDFGSLLKLFMRQKGVTHHRRGPGLYTLARQFRKYERLKHTVSKILGRACGPGRARGAPRRFRRRSRRR